MTEPEPRISFDTEPSAYRHWRLEVEGDVAFLRLDVADDGGIAPDHELRMTSPMSARFCARVARPVPAAVRR